MCSVHSIQFVKLAFPAKIWFVKTSTRIVKYKSRVLKLNPDLKWFISIKKDGEVISNKKEGVELFNQNFINIMETSSEKKPSLGDSLNASQDELTIK